MTTIHGPAGLSRRRVPAGTLTPDFAPVALHLGLVPDAANEARMRRGVAHLLAGLRHTLARRFAG